MSAAVWQASLDAFRARTRDAHAPALRDAMRTHRALPLLWVPPVLSAREWQRITAAVEGVYRALRVVDDVAARPRGTRDNSALIYPDNARALAPPGDDARAGLQSCRLDALYDPDSGALAFVEVQAGDPSGMGLSDLVTSALAEAGIIEAVKATRPSLTRALLEVLGGDSGHSGHSGLIVIAATAKSLAIDADHAALVDEMRRRGVRARHVSPAKLRVVDVHGQTRVTLDGENVSALLRDAPDDLDDDDAGSLALALPHVHYMNPLRDARLDDKRSFVLLRDARVQARLDENTRALVEQLVPETIELATDQEDERVRDKNAWVLKPALGFGGHGVIVGRNVDDAQWRDALQRARERAPVEPTVAQRYVATSPTPWPVLDADAGSGSGDGDVDVVPRYTTWSFWVHGGRVSGAFVRAGEGAVVNVHQGGGIGPVLVGRET